MGTHMIVFVLVLLGVTILVRAADDDDSHEKQLRKIHYLQIELLRQENIIENLGHKLDITLNNIELKEKRAMSNLRFMLDEQMENISNESKLGHPCECVGPVGPPGLIGLPGVQGRRGDKGTTIFNQGIKGKPGDMGDFGEPGRDCI